MKKVFVDSGAFFAHLVADDANHARSAELFDRAARDRWSLVTSNAVVFESYALLVNRAAQGRRLALGLLDALKAGGFCKVLRLTADDEQRAEAICRNHDDKEYSLCDASSFALMERLGIKEAAAYDRHYREYGRFLVLPG